MTQYGIIVCPRCRQVKSADLIFKTTKCIRCNKIINLKKIKIIFKDSSQENVRQVIGKINNELHK